MKKTYMMPETQVYKLNIESLLDSASVNNLNPTKTAAADDGDGGAVNFSREGKGFFDE